MGHTRGRMRYAVVAVGAGLLTLVVASVVSTLSVGAAALLAVAVAVAAEAAQLLYGLVRALRTPPSVGAAGSLVGATGVVKQVDDHGAQVLADGARWTARSALPLMTGMRVRVTAVEGLEITVEPIPHPRTTAG